MITTVVLLTLFPIFCLSVPPNYSKIIQDNIKSENIRRYLKTFTKEPHIGGTEANLRVAHSIVKAWSKAGLEDVHFLPYEVLLSYPDFKKPNTLVIESANGKEVFRTKGVSPVIIPEEQSDKYAGHQWLAYSANGSVTGDVVYVNRGTHQDFANLKLMGIDVKGKIALMRYGGLYRGDKVYNAQMAGAIGAVLFSDPYDVAQEADVYPKKNWMPAEGVQRGSLFKGYGDPLSPHYPSKRGLFRRKTVEEIKKEGLIPSIPVLPISYTTANQILRRMTGRQVPVDWQGMVGTNLTYRLGPGFVNGEKLTVNVHSKLETRRIQNIIGYIRGSEEPDKYVMLGNHYDAWVYGAIDPISGTATMAELARAMMQTVNETGWRPARTIVFNAWDAEEPGLIGSTEFVEEFADILQDRAVVYLNMDCVFGNASLHVQTVPTLHSLAIRASKNVGNPFKSERAKGRTTLYDTWIDVFPDKEEGPEMNVPGAQSDDAAFLNFAGVPVIGITFKNRTTRDTYPLYHSMYETRFVNDYLIDIDNLSIHRALGQYWTELAVSFADEPVLPMNVTHFSKIFISRYLPQLQQLLLEVNVSRIDVIQNQFSQISETSENLLIASGMFQKTIDSAKSPKDLKAVNDRLISFERCFINPRGVSPMNPSARHLLFSASDSDSYSNTMMAGVQNALATYSTNPSEPNLREIANQISIVQYSLICVINTLRDRI